MGLIDITRQIGITTVCPAKDTANLDRRTHGHIDDGATGYTLVATGSIGCANLSADEIKDGGGRDAIGVIFCFFRIKCGHDLYWHIIDSSGRSCFVTHANATEVTSSEHLHILILCIVLRYVYQDIAAILHDIAVRVS